MQRAFGCYFEASLVGTRATLASGWCCLTIVAKSIFCLVKYALLLWVWGIGTRPVWSPRIVPSNSFWVVLFLASGRFLTYMLEDSRKTHSRKLELPFSAALFSLALFPVNSCHLSYPESSLHLINSGRLLGSAWLYSLYTKAWKFPQEVSRDKWRAFSSLISCLLGITIFNHLTANVLKTIVSSIYPDL